MKNELEKKNEQIDGRNILEKKKKTEQKLDLELRVWSFLLVLNLFTHLSTTSALTHN